MELVIALKQQPMTGKRNTILLLLITGGLIFSCSPKNISSAYYFQHQQQLDKIESSYRTLYLQQPFNISFTDKKFETVSVQFITDTLHYIYEFTYNELRLKDTLLKYHSDTAKVVELIRQVKDIRCTSINNYDYYLEGKKHTLVLMYIKPVVLHSFFSYKKYYTLTYFLQPQYFDSTGHLLDKRKLRSLRKINGEVFTRINDKVCYTISGDFR